MRVDAPTSLRLSDLEPGLLFGSGDVIAGVSARVAGLGAGSALLALDPEQALAWIRAAAPGQPVLEAFVRLGAALLEEVSQQIASALGHEPGALEAPSLEERPTSAALLATNAPSDTEMLALEVELEAGTAVARGAVYLLIEPKALLAGRI